MSLRCRSAGFSLVEVIITIVVVSIAATGIAMLVTKISRNNVDPLYKRQALAIANSIVEEVMLMPSTFCDPDDATASSAASATVGVGACTSTVENVGPETIGGVTETRYGGTQVNSQFDNANDYDGFTMNAGNGGIKDVTGSAIAALNKYSVSVSVSAAGMPGSAAAGTGSIPAADALLVRVSVTAPDGNMYELESYKTTFAPTSLP